MAATVTFLGTVVQNGVPVQGTFKIASTTTTTAVASPISTSGGVKVAISCSYGDTLTLTSDTGTSVTKTTVLAVQPSTSQAFQFTWDTGANLLTGI